MKTKKTLTWAAVLAMAVTPVAAYSAMAEETPAAKEAIPEELVVQGEYNEFGNLQAGGLNFYPSFDDSLTAMPAWSDKESITEMVIPSYVKYTKDGKEYTQPVKIIGEIYAGGDFYVDGGFPNLKSVTIPDTVDMLAKRFFFNCSSLTSITLPKNIAVNYGNGCNPFLGCTQLADIEVDPQNERLYSKDGVLFNGDTLVSYPGGKTDKVYVIPNGVVNLVSGGFNNSYLTKLYVPRCENGIINGKGFYECPNLTDIFFGGSEDEWNSMKDKHCGLPFGNGLENVTIHFNAQPTDVDPDWTPDGTPKVTKFSDEETGIEITAASGVFPEGVTFNAKLLDSTADSNSYNLSFTDAAGNEVQPNGKVTVSIPLPEDWETAYAYRVEGDTKTLLQSTIKNGKVVFTTDHFSVYMITAEKLDTSDEPTTSEPTTSEPSISEPTTGEPATSESATSEPLTVTPGATEASSDGDNSGSGDASGDGSGNDQAATGIALAIAPVVLAASAAIVISKKRK